MHNLCSTPIPCEMVAVIAENQKSKQAASLNAIGTSAAAAVFSAPSSSLHNGCEEPASK